MSEPSHLQPQSAAFYRRRAAEARRVAEDVTTSAIKERLLGLAKDLDRQADAIEMGGNRESEEDRP
jgi:hypothetical protein